MTRSLALILTVLTGFTGLVYEVAWQRYLATLLGSHSEATATILGIFLGGLALGYALFAGATRATLRAGHGAAALLLLYAGAETAIGLHALVFPQLFQLAGAAAATLAIEGRFASFAADVALAAALIGPPAVLMGGTIPVLTQALVNALLAPITTEWVGLLSTRLGEDEAGRSLRLEPRSVTR